MIALGTLADGRELSYDAALYEFRAGRSLATYAEVAALDRAGRIRWLALEQRDWFWRIDAADLDRCNRAALARHGSAAEGLSAEEQVLADAKRDDSVLAGKIVDANPVLVQAVAAALEEQGLVGAAAAQPAVALPQGMEALGQLQGQQGRKMTVMEHFLMRQILKADDKAKVKREKEEDALEEAELAEAKRQQEELERSADVSKGQERMEKKEKRAERVLRRRTEKTAGEDERAAEKRPDRGSRPKGGTDAFGMKKQRLGFLRRS